MLLKKNDVGSIREKMFFKKNSRIVELFKTVERIVEFVRGFDIFL